MQRSSILHEQLLFGIEHGQLLFGSVHGQLPFESHPKLHHASNSSRCSSSVIENSSSNPNLTRSCSVITTSREGCSALEKPLGARVSGVADTAVCGWSKQSGSGDWTLIYSSASVIARFSAQQLNSTAASKPKINRSFLPNWDRFAFG